MNDDLDATEIMKLLVNAARDLEICAFISRHPDFRSCRELTQVERECRGHGICAFCQIEEWLARGGSKKRRP
jgi:hypothetical protein